MGWKCVSPTNATWNHNFDMTMPHCQDMLAPLSSNGKEKVQHLKLQNSRYMIYNGILTTPCFKALGSWKDYHTGPLG